MTRNPERQKIPTKGGAIIAAIAITMALLAGCGTPQGYIPYSAIENSEELSEIEKDAMLNSIYEIKDFSLDQFESLQYEAVVVKGIPSILNRHPKYVVDFEARLWKVKGGTITKKYKCILFYDWDFFDSMIDVPLTEEEKLGEYLSAVTRSITCNGIEI